jgi:hypothetical protein
MMSRKHAAIEFFSVFVALLLVSMLAPAFVMAGSCGYVATDWTGRNWYKYIGCASKSANGATEIVNQANGEVWQIAGTNARQISPGLSWLPGLGWFRDESRDRVLWEGKAAPTASPCAADAKGGAGWDFSSGVRICVFNQGR